ncbi:wax ester/triacylglycerol synthase family O-acyltransferase [Rubrivirga sp.]|uniref:wax ester/triacylglycerol synthase family O-acyltransferase n=1 Tax=Rubrivirga sp. TaxID=1885344 RepID=UPI003C720A5D
MDRPRPFPVSPPDSAWLRMEVPTNPMTITGVVGFGSELSLEDLRDFVTERLVRFSRFRMRIEDMRSTTPRWVPDDAFDIEHHVLEADLPAPGGQTGLEELVSRLMSEPLSFDHSPWTFHLVHGIEDEDGAESAAIVVRLHHVIGDGIALMHVLINAVDEYFDLEDETSRPRKRPKLPTPKRVAKTLKNAGTETAELLMNPSHLGGRLKAAGSGVSALGHLLAMRPDSVTTLKGQTSPVKRAAWTRPFVLEDIKSVGHALDAKVNDVLMTAAGGALRRFLMSKNEPVDALTVRVAAPFNVRPLERAHELGNSFGLVFVELPVSQPTVRERLSAMKARMDAAKSSSEPAVVYGILQTIGRAPMWIHSLVVKMFSEKATGVLTNVPGPDETLHIKAAPITTIMFWVPQAGDIGLGISIISLDGSVRVGVTTDAAYVENPAEIARAFEDEFDALVAEFVTEAAA